MELLLFERKPKVILLLLLEEKDWLCNVLENGYLDGKGKPQKLQYRLADAIYEEPEEFEVLCDGFHQPRKGQEPTYKPEFGHLYKVTKEGGLGGTEPMFDNGICWPKFVCEKPN